MRGDHMALYWQNLIVISCGLRGSAASGISAACASFAVSITDQPPLRLQQATTRMFQVMAAVWYWKQPTWASEPAMSEYSRKTYQ